MRRGVMMGLTFSFAGTRRLVGDPVVGPLPHGAVQELAEDHHLRVVV
jgi:hypothetical protein